MNHLNEGVIVSLAETALAATIMWGLSRETRKPRHVCLTHPPQCHIYMRRRNGSTLVHIMAWRRPGDRPLFEPMFTYCHLESKEHISMKFYLKFKDVHPLKCGRKRGNELELSACSGIIHAPWKHRHRYTCRISNGYDHLLIQSGGKRSNHLTHHTCIKWPQFRRRHFRMNFEEWKVLYFDLSFTEVCSQGSNYFLIVIM